MLQVIFHAMERTLPRRLVDILKILRMVVLNPCHIHVGLLGDLTLLLSRPDGPALMAGLRHGLDIESLDVLDLLLARIRFFQHVADGYLFFIYADTLLSQREREALTHWHSVRTALSKRYGLPERLLCPEAFMYHHGLVCLSAACHAYIVGKDALDIGAFIGDSALVLNVYHPRRIYCFEISPLNCKRFLRTMQRNLIAPDRFELVRAGVSDTCGQLRFYDTGQSNTAIGNAGSTEVDVMTVDAFVMQRSAQVGVVKMDIEGMGLKAVHGMVNTLRTHRPILLLAVYHNVDELCKIKPFIESLDLNYSFALRALSPEMLSMETTLLVYPAELGAVCSVGASGFLQRL